MVTYIFQVVLFQLLFLGVYQLWLRKETFFNYNRWYLLGTSILSLVLPFIKIQVFNQVIPQQIMAQLPAVFLGGGTINGVELPETTTLIENGTSSFEINYLYLWMIGMCVASLYFVFKLHKLYQLQQKNTKLKHEDYVLVQLQNSTDAFSFFKFIFLGNQLTQNQQADILKHEKTHVKQWHSVDLLWFELLRIVFWFNPMVYLFQQQITEVHEFIADKTVAKNKMQYYKNLLSQTFGVQQLSIINQFYSSSLIKKRIIMLTKQQSKSRKLVKYLSIIPLVIGMLFYVSCSEADQKENLPSSVEYVTNTDHIKIVVKTKEDLLKIDWENVSSQLDRLNENESIKLIVRYYDPLLTRFKKHDSHDYGLESSVLKKKELISTAKEMVVNIYNNDKVKCDYSMMNRITPFVKVSAEEVDYTNQADVPFNAVDKSPVFPGCDNTTSAETLKKCFQESLTKVVSENFNTQIAKTANLTGRQKILVQFKIDTEGYIADIRVRAAHAVLKTEAERVIKLIPLMKAGEYNGKAVNVMYSLPIIFKI